MPQPATPRVPLRRVALGAALLLVACGGSPKTSSTGTTSAAGAGGATSTGTNAATSTGTGMESPVTGYAIATVSGNPLVAVAGDAVALEVVETLADGSTQKLPAGATVTWSGPPVITALPPNSMAASPLPLPGAAPTAVFILNPGRPDRPADLGGVVFILDAGSVAHGSVDVDAAVSGAGGAGAGGKVTASIAVSPTPAGNAANGAATYGFSCAPCHGATGAGSPPISDGGMMYTYGGVTYDYPAPGLNADPGNLASSNQMGGPAWSAALLAIAARADIDNGGVTLRKPMADWLSTAAPGAAAPYTTQDFADIYAFLQTQM